ncbi:MAG: metal ABC transporter permease [Eubacterium sp.]|nr:metal ABC transporter permease [Eubacterium sp.]MCD7854648.1 metal ABC transporter permease [Clostridiales bacterium]
MEIFTYAFIRRAFAVGLFISIITPLIGNTIVLKRLSSIGDALSHASLAGVAIGLFASVNPIGSAVAFACLAALAIEFFRRFFPNYSEISTAVVLSIGVGLAAVFSSLVKNTASFNSFLFGSIVAITPGETAAVIVLSAAVIVITLLLYRELFYIAFDEEGAALSGVPVKGINFAFTLLTAVAVSVSARTVGALVISSLMVIPVACALLVSKSYRQNIILSVVFAVCFTLIGLFISCFWDIAPGGTIVLCAAAFLLVLLPFRKK